MGKPSSDRQRMALFHSTIPSRYQAPLESEMEVVDLVVGGSEAGGKVLPPFICTLLGE